MSSPLQFDQLLKTIDFSQPTLWATMGMVVFNPVFWNCVARNEYHNKTLTKACGSPYKGTYFLAVTIFSLGIFRDLVYERALSHQPPSPALSDPMVKGVGAGLFVLGQVLVLSSIWALGITGTYLGDYFGILLSHRITSFPFNLMTDPMYDGSTLCFLGTALWFGKAAGLVVSGVVWVVYRIALRFEGPFTDKIYSTAAAKKKASSTTTSLPSKKDLSSAISSSISTAKSTASDGLKSVGKVVEDAKSASAGAGAASGEKRQAESVNAKAKGTAGAGSKSTSTTGSGSGSASGSGSYASAAHPSSTDSLPSTNPTPVPEVNLPTAGRSTATNGRVEVISNIERASTPAKNARAQSVQPGEGAGGVPGSPMRMTRSRSRARIVDDD